MTIQITCFHCRAVLQFEALPGRSASCDSCHSDVRVCLNCRHYDAQSYNECREPVAERVVDKDRRTFCDYFSPAPTGNDPRAQQTNTKADVLKKLDDLFKK